MIEQPPANNDPAETAVSQPSTLPIIKPTGWQTPLLTMRDKAIFALLRVDSTGYLNRERPSSMPQSAETIATQLLQTLRQLQTKAISDDGQHVDYAAIRTDPAYQTLRQDVLPTLHHLDPTHFAEETTARAFWVNLYNTLVIDAIVQLDIQKSVTEGWIGILAFFRRAAYMVAGQRLSLEDIENGILRGNRGHPYFPGAQFGTNDPRLSWVLPLDPLIHFGLNCASRSCPPIDFFARPHLAQQFDVATRNFVDVSTKTNPAENELIISQIFNWYKEDFGGRKGLIQLMLDYLPQDERHRFLEKNKSTVKLTFANYDWGLNK